MNPTGTVVMSGGVSQYNLPANEQHAPRNMFDIVSRRLNVRGFSLVDYAHQFHEGKLMKRVFHFI